MDYQVGVTPCPQCGGSDQVRTARQLFDMMNGARGFQQPGFQQPTPSQQPQQFGRQSYQQQPGSFGQPAPFGQPTPFGQPEAFGQGTPLQQGTPFPEAGQPPGQGPGSGQPGQPAGTWSNSADDYDHYNAEGSRSGFPFGGNRSRRDGLDALREGLDGDIGGAVVGAALGFAGRALAKRMKKTYDEKIAPAMEARIAQAQQQAQQRQEQSRSDQDAIAARYPELRGCLADQVIFLDGGDKTVPVSEITLPVTLAQADAVVARLR